MKKIIILHGWTYDLSKWQPFINGLRKAGFEPVVLKIPGLTQKSEEVWDLNKYADWLKNILVKEKDDFYLLGHSNGGRIAIYFTSKYPQLVKKLILIDSAGIYHKELYIELKRFLFKTVAKVGKKFSKSEAFRKFLYTLAKERDYYRAPEKTKDTMINMIKSDIKSDLSVISVPTLIIWGRDDKITPLSDADLMKSLIRGSELVIIDGARHTPFYTHIDQVIKIIKDAL